MRIILDTNVLFSALIRDSLTRKIILEFKDKFLFPSYIFEELEEHKEEIRIKSKLEDYDFELVLSRLLERVEIVGSEKLEQYKEEAVEIAKKIDLDDSLFFACALAYPDSIIWSDDRALKRQIKIRIIDTLEMMEILEKFRKDL